MNGEQGNPKGGYGVRGPVDALEEEHVGML